MRDPHVVELRYRLVLSGDDEFRDPPPVERERDAFSMRLADDLLTVTMKEHHPTIESARARVEPFVQSWEISAALQYRRRQVSFEYKDADVIDRDPPLPGEPQVFEESEPLILSVIVSGSDRMTHRAYPSPPDAFKASSDVQLMWTRFDQYLEGREPLPSMAFFCLTVVEASLGLCTKGRQNRPAAATAYYIDKDILSTLGTLTSEHGDATSARKAHDLKPLTARAKHWIQEAVLVLIRRLGEHAAEPDTPKPMITMADLPSLKNGDVS